MHRTNICILQWQVGADGKGDILTSHRDISTLKTDKFQMMPTPTDLQLPCPPSEWMWLVLVCVCLHVCLHVCMCACNSTPTFLPHVSSCSVTDTQWYQITASYVEEYLPLHAYNSITTVLQYSYINTRTEYNAWTTFCIPVIQDIYYINVSKFILII